ncbi:hypothetical protein DB35_18555 [Streptomyces abyssalis]|uniref:Integral membrane protein n=2 Tax=Streptomyces abyssalis TaxID=933944 RepID=A0A1E7JM06_9ACTN|nr:hypothetical protein [Streptomyces abyssalis]OEU88686.1 hypothetical protein AN215_19705 [Streptomyces abyssalis]OEU91337.1 hypothetical protein DB35_18555 [Streptomyces abyssalis]
MDMDAAGIRTARAVVFTVLCVTLSAGSHVLLSGVPLPLGPLLAVTGVIFLLAFALADRERGYGRIAAVLIPLELLADTVFTAGQHTCYGQAGGPVTGPLRTVGVDLLCGGSGVGTPLAHLAAQSGGRDAAETLSQGDGNGTLEALGPVGPLEAAPSATPFVLLAAHIAVGLLAAAWLRRGEAALAGLLRAASVTAFRPLRLAVAAGCRTCDSGEPAPAPRSLPVLGPRTLPLLTHSVHRRGPPPLVLAA